MKAVRKAVALAATTAALVALVACSDSGPNAGQFTKSVDGICRTLGKGLGDLDKPTTVDDLTGFAGDASELFATAVSAMKKLEVPGGSSAAVSDAKTLVKNLDHLVDVLDDIRTAAKAADQSAIDQHTTEFESVRAENSDLADSLDARNCDLDPLFDELAPPVTDPPVTVPPITNPPVDNGGSNKTTLNLAGQLTPIDGITFTDSSEQLLTAWTTVLDTSSTAAATPGQVAGVEIRSGGTLVATIYIFLPTDTVPFSAVSEIITTLTETTVGNDTINGFPGYSWTSDSGVTSFIGGQNSGDAGYLLYALAPNHDALVAGITGLWASLPK